MLQFLDGTIVFRQGTEIERGWRYDLEANFSDGVGQAFAVPDLMRLQGHFHGHLDVTRLPDGNAAIHQEIIAHGAESACKQAHDLLHALRRYLGIEKMNFVCA